MPRLLVTTLALLTATAAARAHFVFVVPDGDGKANVVLSEDLKADEAIDAALLKTTKLTVRDANGKDAAVALTPAAHALTATVPGSGPRVVFGSTDLGVRQRGNAKPFRLTYHPKAVLGAAGVKLLTLGDAVPAEVIPAGDPGKPRFRVLAKGKPLADAEVTVLPPGGESKKVKTDADGLTPAFEAAGRYGVWARYVEAAAGESGGKKYEEVRHYPTLVYDAPAARAAGPMLPPLPEAVSSLGAIVSNGYLYIYGGHKAKTHTYWTGAVSGRFARLKLTGGTWEDLPGGPPAQGMNLAAHKGKVYRIGGMQPRNKQGEKADNHSLAECARFDPATGRWERLPPLPEGRSSHDVVVVGDTLVVVGGWAMRGRGEKSTWHDTALLLDLNAPKPEWKSVKQPFRRRALTAASLNGKVYVLGGLSDKNDASRRAVDVYDVATGTWTTGPEYPGAEKIMGFSPAACTAEGRLYISTSDGAVNRLSADGKAWEPAGRLTTRRVVHRLVPASGGLLAVGGASPQGNVAALEYVEPIPAAAASAGR
jgi:outer membrane protein assembly factor BamB